MFLNTLTIEGYKNFQTALDVEFTEGLNVLVVEWTASARIEQVLYTDFNPAGKETTVTAEALAKQAIASVTEAPPGKDGIFYLRDNIAASIHTPLTDAYRDEILKQTNTTSLDDALAKVRKS